MDIFIPGIPCIVNGLNDLYMDFDARPFIGQECFIIKRTKGGLIQVALKSNIKKMHSFAQRNIDLPPVPNLEFEKALSYEQGMMASDENYRRTISRLEAEVNRLNKRLHAAESRVRNLNELSKK